jgi:recombinational DNA repair ATPase RecF
LDVRLSPTEQAEIELRLAKGSRKALLNGTPIASVAQHLGQFPTIVFCSDDLRLVRGSPGNRRRWLDAAIGGTDCAYLTAVRDYTRALEGRNALLKSDRRSDEELRAFEQAMQAPGELIARTRARILPELAATLREVCAEAMDVIGKDWSDPPDTWLFNHRWKDGGRCPRSKKPLVREDVGGRTTCWSPERQALGAERR